MRSNRIWLAVYLALSLALVVGAYYWATLTMEGMYAYRSPLQNQPPAPGEGVPPALTGRVVFVLIDGLRFDTSQDAEVMPVLAQLRASGASARMHSRPPSYSQPGYVTLLSGAWPDINDGPPVNLDYALIPTMTQDNLFSAAKRAGGVTAVSGDNWVGRLLPAESVDLSFYTPGEDSAADRAVTDAALPWLGSGQAGLVQVHIDQVDYAGHHEGGPRDLRWNQAAARADGLLGEILAALDLSRDTVLVVSDHGHIDEGGPGGTDAVTLVEPFVLAGKGVRPGQYADVQMVDVAPTLAALLGANLPASAEGLPLLDMLDLPPAQKSALEAAVQAQQAGVAEAYRKATGMLPPAWSDTAPGVKGIALARSARLARERLPRGILVLLIALALGRVVFGSLPRPVARLLAAGLFVVVFNLGYALVSGKTYTLSSVTGVTDLILLAGGWALAAALVAGGLYAWRTGLSLRRPAEFCAGLLEMGMTVAFVLLLPLLLSFALNGFLPEWTLPDFDSTFVALLSAIQVLVCGALGVLVALGGLAAPQKA
ncbi:MAG TPA: alkaline phosphatase family protein [Anaerolinea sp.]|nr:alkaline phosphatase family protein [Anaerolinea sp.]